MYTTYDFIKGGISGMVGVVISHPFDTIKSNIQAAKPIKYQLRDLYRGISSPLIGVGFEKAIVFGTYNNVHSYLRSNQIREPVGVPLSGAIAGWAASFIVTPVERIKILRQTGSPISTNNLFGGLSATFTREIPGFSIYFSVYEHLKYRYFNKGRINTGASFLFGGLSGLAAWLFIYPQDLIKTKIQANTASKLTFIPVAKAIYGTGIMNFYKGFSLALLRAIPLHAGTFATMEKLSNF